MTSSLEVSVSLEVHVQGATKAWREAVPEVVALVERAARAACAQVSAEPTSCAIQLSGDATVRSLNAQFRGQDKPTNVLSFPSDEPGHLGDIILARQTIEREAAAQGKSVAAHLQHLVVHGMLHLMGHDHEEEGQAESMEAIEIKILKSLGVDNPYLLP